MKPPAHQNHHHHHHHHSSSHQLDNPSSRSRPSSSNRSNGMTSSHPSNNSNKNGNNNNNNMGNSNSNNFSHSSNNNDSHSHSIDNDNISMDFVAPPTIRRHSTGASLYSYRDFLASGISKRSDSSSEQHRNNNNSSAPNNNNNGSSFDMDREQTRLESFEAYVLVSILTASASFTVLSECDFPTAAVFVDHDEIDDNSQFHTLLIAHLSWWTRVATIFLAGVSAIAGLHATVVFSLSVLYGKSALGRNNDAAYLAFVQTTSRQRVRAFNSFSASLLCFALLIALLLVEKAPKPLWGPAILVATYATYYVFCDWLSILDAAKVIYREQQPPKRQQPTTESETTATTTTALHNNHHPETKDSDEEEEDDDDEFLSSTARRRSTSSIPNMTRLQQQQPQNEHATLRQRRRSSKPRVIKFADPPRTRIASVLGQLSFFGPSSSSNDNWEGDKFDYSELTDRPEDEDDEAMFNRR